MSDTKLILRILCDHRGSLDVQRLRKKTVLVCPDVETSLQKLLADGQIAVRKGERGPPGGSFGPDTLIVAKTNLRFCQDRGGNCADCGGLHLCKFWLRGNCTFGQKCKTSHDLSSPHNAQLLMKHGLQDLTTKQLYHLLLQNDSFLLPEICQHYNKGQGEHGICKFTTSCIKLHVCQHHYHSNCKFGSSCKRTHDISADGLKLLKGMSQEDISNLTEIYRNKLIVEGHPAAALLPTQERAPMQKPAKSNPRPPGADAAKPASDADATKPASDADKNEICLFNIRRNCSFQDKCVRVHWYLPYRWQVLSSDGVTWKDFPNMEDIERAYCDPANQSSLTGIPTRNLGIFRGLSLSVPSTDTQLVDFDKMTFGESPVRRLSTASYSSKPPHYLFTTKWLWYWKDDSMQWQEFGQDYGDGKAAMSSETLENIYLEDRETQIPFQVGGHQYMFHFRDAAGNRSFYQHNIKYKTKREVRRRPNFVSAQDVEKKLKSVTSSSPSTSPDDIYPKHWDKDGLHNVDYKLVHLSQTEEYKMIKELFMKTLPHTNILSIKRIQSPSLWQGFKWQKEQMTKRNGGKSVDEKYLFHGTDESLVEAICVQNFDWRMCGVHGTRYGKGSYFAKDASYSDRYAAVSQKPTKTMFVALVLVGDYAKGHGSYVRPPPRGEGMALYDSCVDNVHDPSIYVVFERHQVYPAYIISYN